MEGAMSKMKKLTVIGKATIKDISVIKEWFESKEAKHWLDENWAPTAPAELAFMTCSRKFLGFTNILNGHANNPTILMIL